MRTLLFIIVFAFAATAYSKGQNPPKVAIVCYTGSTQIFPGEWLNKKINAWATAADTAKFHRDTAALYTAFNKYPNSVLEDGLTTIYITRKLSFNRQFFTGTNANKAIYIGSKGNDEIEKTFHHEFSSILLRTKRNYNFEADWKTISPSLRSGNSASAMRAGFSSTGFDTVLCKQGYLTPYSLSNFENDFNMYAENIFAGGKAFWKIVDEYPKVLAKVKLMVIFYQTVWPGYSEYFFRGMADVDNSD